MIVNWGTDYVVLGTLGSFECPACGKTRTEVAVLQYHYAGLFWLFCCSFSKKYLRVCGECKQGYLVDKNGLGILSEKGDVPFMRKYGLILFVIGCIVLLNVGSS